LVYRKPVPPCCDTKSSILSSSLLSIVCKIQQQISIKLTIHHADENKLFISMLSTLARKVGTL